MLKIQDYILDETPINQTNMTAAGKKAPVVRKAPEVTYTVVKDFLPDIIITRKTSRTESQLVLLVTQRQYYIKSVKPEKAPELLDVKNLLAFLQKCTVELDCGWLTHLTAGGRSGSDRAVHLLRALKTPLIIKAIKAGMYEFNWCHSARYYYSYKTPKGDDLFPLCKEICLICSEYMDVDGAKAVLSGYLNGFNPPMRQTTQLSRYTALFSQMDTLVFLDNQIGIDGLRTVLKEYVREPLLSSLPSEYRLARLFVAPHGYLEDTENRGVRIRVPSCSRNFKIDAFTEYLIHECVRQGFGDNADTFVNSWTDYLQLQEKVYGKVRDKYSPSLASDERRLSFKYSLFRTEIEGHKFEERAEQLKQYRYRDSKYIISAPQTKEDMLDEAVQQSNCLAGYVSRYADGDTSIYLMRHRDDPTKSFVTVEVTRDKYVSQALLRSNHTPPAEVTEWLVTWAKRNGFGFSCNGHQFAPEEKKPVVHVKTA